MILFPIVEEVLRKGDVSPQRVDILIVNCSLFNPTPSLASMVCLYLSLSVCWVALNAAEEPAVGVPDFAMQIVNRFKMRQNIKSFNLAGMGCSAGASLLSPVPVPVHVAVAVPMPVCCTCACFFFFFCTCTFICA